MAHSPQVSPNSEHHPTKSGAAKSAAMSFHQMEGKWCSTVPSAVKRRKIDQDASGKDDPRTRRDTSAHANVNTSHEKEDDSLDDWSDGDSSRSSGHGSAKDLPSDRASSPAIVPTQSVGRQQRQEANEATSATSKPTATQKHRESPSTSATSATASPAKSDARPMMGRFQKLVCKACAQQDQQPAAENRSPTAATLSAANSSQDDDDDDDDDMADILSGMMCIHQNGGAIEIRVKQATITALQKPTIDSLKSDKQSPLVMHLSAAKTDSEPLSVVVVHNHMGIFLISKNAITMCGDTLPHSTPKPDLAVHSRDGEVHIITESCEFEVQHPPDSQEQEHDD
ncbi:unnamed protein product [Sympodiomycopsis kandeliae]